MRFYNDGVRVDDVSEIDDSSTDPMLTLDYDWSDGLNTYIRYATGYKAGGVNLRSRSFIEYDKEQLTTWELGVKTTFWDQRARLNLAIWDGTYEDYQIDFSDPFDITISETINATNGDVDLSGVELEFTIIPLPGLTIAADYNYLDWSLRPQPNPLDPLNRLEVFEITQAPRHAGTLAIDYEFEPFSFGTLILHADYIGQSADGMRYTPNGNRRRDGRDVFNARIILADIPVSGEDAGFFRASLWGRNLTDTEYVMFSITNKTWDTVSDAWNVPRTFGLELVYEYQ